MCRHRKLINPPASLKARGSMLASASLPCYKKLYVDVIFRGYT